MKESLGKANAWMDSLPSYIPLGVLMAAFIIWQATETLHIEPIKQVQEHQTTILVKIGATLEEMKENDIISQRLDAEAHEAIRTSVNKLSSKFIMLSHSLTDVDEDCDDHIKNGVHK